MICRITRLFLLTLFAAFLFGFGATLTEALDEEWTLQRTVPYDIDVFRDGMFLEDGQNGWMVGFIQYGRTHSGAALLKSTDGGAIWTEHEIGISYVIEALQFLDESNGWVVGNKGIISTSTDGGITWTTQTSGTESRLRDLFFIDQTTGWAVGDNTILFTTNGGEQWNGAATRYTSRFNAVTFPTQRNGWIVGNDGIMYRTSDAGSTWSVFSGPSTEDLTAIFFHDEQIGWIAGSNGTLLATTDGGLTWLPMTSGTVHKLHDLFFIDEQNGWTVGSMGTMLFTADGGYSWTPVQVPTSTTLTTLTLTAGGSGWACGEGGVCLVKRNTGTSWQHDLQGPNAKLVDVVFTDAKFGWACGWDGTILHTTDGGQQWLPQQSGLDALLFGIDFIDRHNGCIVTFEGNILRTTNGGEDWSVIQSPAGTFRSLDFHEPDHFWVVGEHNNMGVIFDVQADGSGYSIAAQVSIGGSLHDIRFADPSRGWAVGSNGTILHTSDGGQSWEVQVSGLEADLTHIQVYDTEKASIAGDFDGLLQTSDGGETWSPIQLPQGYSYGPIFFPTALTGWVVGRSEADGSVVMWSTTDGGSAWNPFSMPLEDGFSALHFVTEQEGWAVGEKGNIWYYTNLPLYAISGRALYCENEEPIGGTQVFLSGALNDTLETDEEGSFRFDGLRHGRSFCVDARMKETPQHVITSFDASLILSSLLGRYDLDACDSIAADVTGDKTIGSLDVSNILRYVVGQDVEGLTGQWTFSPGSHCFDDLQSDRSDERITGIIYGDVSQNWPGLPGIGVPEVLVQLPSGGAAAGTQFEKILFASSISLTPLDSLDIFSYQVQIEYDPSLLQVTAVKDTGLFTENWGSLFSKIDNIAGRIYIAKASTFPLPWSAATSAPLVRIHFSVNPRAASGSTSPLVLSSMIFNEGTPWSETVDVLFEVLKHTISGTVSYCSTQVAVPDVNIALAGDSTFYSSTDDIGWYLFSNLVKNRDYCVTTLSKENVPEHVVSSYDAACVFRHLAGSYPLGDCFLTAADVNRNGTIDSDDAQKILRSAVGESGSGHTATWSFTPPGVCYDVLPADQREQNYSAFIYGDVSGNYPGSIPSQDSPWLLVSIPDESVDPGATIGLSVLIDTFSTPVLDSLEIYSFDFHLRYDPYLLTALYVSTEGLPTEPWGTLQSIIDNETGSIRIGLAGADRFMPGLTQDIPLVKVDFLVNEEAALGTESSLILQDVLFNEGSPKTYRSGGSIHITGRNISGTIRYCDSQEPVDGITLQIFSFSTERATTAGDGTYLFSNLEIGHRYCVFTVNGRDLLPGQDVISSFDAALVLRHVIGLTPFSPCDSVAADVSGDGSITAYDASVLLRYVASYDIAPETLPISNTGTWHFEPQHRCFEQLLYNETSDYNAILHGDVTQNWPGSSAPKIAVGSGELIGQPKITPHSTNTFSLPLRLDDPKDILAADILLSYDPGEMQAIGARSTASTSDWECFYQVDPSGQIRIAMAGCREPLRSGAFVEIEFETSRDLRTDLSVAVEVSALFNEGQIPSPPTVRHSFKPWSSVPRSYGLAQNYPNPFNPSTTISYQLSAINDQTTQHAPLVTLRIFNLLGQEMKTLVNQHQEPGYYSITWDGTDSDGVQAASGVYFYCLTITGGASHAGSGSSPVVFTTTRKMLLLK